MALVYWLVIFLPSTRPFDLAVTFPRPTSRSSCYDNSYPQRPQNEGGFGINLTFRAFRSHGKTPQPIGSMYGIYTNIWGILMVNVTIYIHIWHTWILWAIAGWFMTENPNQKSDDFSQISLHFFENHHLMIDLACGVEHGGIPQSIHRQQLSMRIAICDDLLLQDLLT